MSEVGKGVKVTVVIFTILFIQRIAEVKAEGAGRSLNFTSSAYDETFNDTNEVPLTVNDRGSDDNPPYPHAAKDKPTKFDMDMSQLMETDDKELLLNKSGAICDKNVSVSCIEENLVEFIDNLTKIDVYNVTDSMQIVREENAEKWHGDVAVEPDESKSSVTLLDKVHQYAKEHAVKIRVNKDLISPRKARTFFGAVFQGKSTFLTGFGLGFLAFGLKKLLLPLIITVQIFKSVLIALFLPSIIGSIGKIVGKGVSSFSQYSQSANPAGQPEENFEFKDNSDFYNEDYMTRQPVGTLPASAMYEDGMMQQPEVQKNEISSRYSFVNPRITQANAISDRYYTRHAITHGGMGKKKDFKIFHEIPTSSLLLTNYDPFYSPLLSRLDAVFSRLGHTTEGCREYAVCAMYRSPARYAPYSNLVSAQLSRELNELRKPSSDNPDVLRFFRYMKAAKDGQDGVRCEDTYGECETAGDDQGLRQNQAMLATYQDIDKLVHARKL